MKKYIVAALLSLSLVGCNVAPEPGAIAPPSQRFQCESLEITNSRSFEIYKDRRANPSKYVNALAVALRERAAR